MLPTISKLRIVHFAKLHFLFTYMLLVVLVKFLLRDEKCVQNEKVGNTDGMGQKNIVCKGQGIRLMYRPGHANVQF